MDNADTLFSQAVKFHQDKELDKAKLSYQQVLEADPTHTPAAINLGAVYRQLNQADEAKDCYKKATEHSPDSIEAWFNFGNLCVALKDWKQAKTCYENILAADPHHKQSLYQLGIIFREQNDWQQCRENLQQLLLINPNDSSALLDMGNTWQHLGERKRALSCYRRLVKHHPNSWKGHYSLARWYDVENKKKLFEKHLQLSLKKVSEKWVVYHSMGQARFDIGKYKGAEKFYRLAIKEDSSKLNSVIGLGACAMHLRRESEARALFNRVGKSDNISILSELARIIWEYKFFDMAIYFLEKIVNLRPEIIDGHLNLAKAYSQNWEISKSSASLEKVLSLQPNCTEAEDMLAYLYTRRGLSTQALDIYEQRVKREGIFSRSVSSYLYTLLYSHEHSAKEKAEKHQKMMQDWVDNLYQKTKFSRSKDKKIRVGFVSADFRDQHPVGIFIEPVFKYYDKDQLHFTAYYNSRTYDDSTLVSKAMVDSWFDVAGWTDDRLRKKIIEDKIDILVDLSGHTAKNRLQMFAMRAAPIQLTWMGYPNSSGLSAMDYMIADPIVCPPENDHLCSETLIRLPKHCVFCLTPTDKFGEVDNEKPAKRKQIVFGSFNNLTKVNKLTLSLWIDVMHAVGDAKLKLKTPSFKDQQCLDEFKGYFKDAGISEDRLIFTGPSALEDMMREYSEVDIALDTLPYNGGTTTFQALWMGVPVIALVGENFCGRMGASIMRYLDMPEWVVEDKESYIKKAVLLANDRKKLLKTKSKLRERMLASPLCDAEGFSKEMNKIFIRIWQQYCKNAKQGKKTTK